MGEINWKRIKKHADLSSAAYYSFLERIMTLSTGALALAITLRGTFVPASPRGWWLLPLSWACFIIAILGCIAIHWSRVEIHKELVEQEFTNPGGIHIASPRPFYRRVKQVVLSTFTLGLILLSIFATLNV